MPSFDVVSEVNLAELDNAFTQTKKEIDTRYDFKGAKATIEKQKADDPRALRRRILELERQLSKGAHVMHAKGHTPKSQPSTPRIIEKPVIADKQLAAVNQLKTALRALNNKIEEAKRKKNVLIARKRRAEAMKSSSSRASAPAAAGT